MFIITILFTATLVACTNTFQYDNNNNTLKTPDYSNNNNNSNDNNNQNNQDNSSNDNNTPPAKANELALVVAQGFEEREIVFRLTVPDLHELMAIDVSCQMSIHFGEGMSVLISLHESWTDYNDRELFNGSHYGNIFLSGSNNGKARGFFDGDNIVVSTYVTQEINYDWNSLDEFVLEMHDGRLSIEQGANKTYYFQKANIEVHLHEILPDMYSLREYQLNPEAISLKAKDNGDGSLTFTYSDTSIKPNYIVPWEWLTIEPKLYMRYTCLIGGKVSYDIRDDEVAIFSDFSFGRHIGLLDDNPWDDMSIYMEDSFMKRGHRHHGAFDLDNYYQIGFIAVVDENGLTATWTEQFYPGYSLNDIAMFGIILSKDVFSTNYDSTFYTNINDVFYEMYFEVEDVMG